MSTLAELQAFLLRLQENRIHFDLASVREGAVMVRVAMPGERWEIEFFANREPAIEIFRSDGEMSGQEKLADLWELAKA